jgi:hypothetical protein
MNRTDEPQWLAPPSREAYAAELAAAGDAPDWLRARLDS